MSRLEDVKGTPTHWWSEYRSWCVNMAWDLTFTLVGGPERLVATLLSDEELECLPVEPSSRVDRNADRINPSAACVSTERGEVSEGTNRAVNEE